MGLDIWKHRTALSSACVFGFTAESSFHLSCRSTFSILRWQNTVNSLFVHKKIKKSLPIVKYPVSFTGRLMFYQLRPNVLGPWNSFTKTMKVSITQWMVFDLDYLMVCTMHYSRLKIDPDYGRHDKSIEPTLQGSL